MLLDFTYYQQTLKSMGIVKDTEICNKVLTETGVALLPGISFGLPAEALCARLAYVDFDGKQALEDIDKYGWSMSLTNKHAQKMSTGIQNLGNYLKQLVRDQ